MEIELKNVSYRYKNKKLLNQININIKDNYVTGITGEYKSLLCEILDAIKLPTSGTITIGSTILNKDNLKWIRKEVSIIHQNYQDQFFTDNIKEEFMFLMERLDYKPRDKNKKMEQALLIVGLDKSYLNKNIYHLSTGEKKLLQIAVSLIHNPNIIIFDEPFVELDLTNQRKLIRLIKMLKEKYEKTVIISSNNSDMLYEITDDMIILKNGNVLLANTTSKVYQNIKELEKNDIEIPNLVMFTKLAKDKKVKLTYHKDIRDLIKDVYKHV